MITRFIPLSAPVVILAVFVLTTTAAAQCGLARIAQAARVNKIIKSGREPAVIGGRIFSLETAITPAEQEHGLMERDHLESDAGMIFVYQYPRSLSFWMADCRINIDILFLDARGRIVSMYAMKAEPPRGENESQSRYEARLEHYPSQRPAQYAVEIHAGLINEMNLKLGEKVSADYARLQQLADEQ